MSLVSYKRGGMGFYGQGWSESQYWEQADPVAGHALAVQSGMKWDPGRGWLNVGTGDGPETVEASHRSGAFWSKADEIVRAGRAAGRGLVWDAVKGQYVSLTAGAVSQSTDLVGIQKQLDAAKAQDTNYVAGAGVSLTDSVNAGGFSFPLWGLLAAGAAGLFFLGRR